MFIVRTYCFKCDKITSINKPKWRVTANNRNLCEGKCSECKGNVARMAGYATLPDNIYSRGKMTQSVTDNGDDGEDD